MGAIDLKKIALFVVVIGIVVGWFASLALPVVTAPSRNDPQAVFEGSSLLAFGFFGILIKQFAWFANLTFWLMLLRLPFVQGSKKGAVSFVVFVHLFLLANLFWWSSWPADEAGVQYFVIQQYHSGFFLWLAVMLIMPVIYLIVSGVGLRVSIADALGN